jgi:hypothetical protein
LLITYAKWWPLEAVSHEKQMARHVNQNRFFMPAAR